MVLRALPLVFVLCGVVLYAVLAGADFGAGLWQLLAGRGERAREIREHAHHSIGPVWEANHVWLIFVLTVFWTGYPKAFGSIASTLAIPLFVAAIGIIFRGATYALRSGAASAREAAAIDTVFAISSVLTPFALGAAAGAIVTGRVPVGNAAGHAFSSWLNPISIFVGVLTVANGAYLAAVYLAADAQLAHHELEDAFRRRALAAALVAGVAAVGGLVVLDRDDHPLLRALLGGGALVAVIVSALAGTATVALVVRRRHQPARYTAATAVAAVIAAVAVARWPTILPGLSVDRAAAGHDTLVWITVAVLAGAVILFPSLALLFRLAMTGRLQGEGALAPPTASGGRAAPAPRPLARIAAAGLIAGVGLLTFADAGWTHAVGLACLLVFAVAAFLAIVPAALAADDETT
jgi:cytochrome bd ubiquinol oxidase subunit II